VLTVNGRAELVILDTETYESMVEQLNYQREKEIAAARAHMAKSLKNAPQQEPITEEEIERRHAILDESGGRDGAAWPVPMTAGSTGPPYRKREYNKNCGIYVKITIANYGGKDLWQS